MSHPVFDALAWIFIIVLSSIQLTIALIQQLQLWLLMFLQVAVTSLPFYRWANIPEIDLAEIPQGNPTGGVTGGSGGWKQTHWQQKEDIEPAHCFSICTKTRQLNGYSTKNHILHCCFRFSVLVAGYIGGPGLLLKVLIWWCGHWTLFNCNLINICQLVPDKFGPQGRFQWTGADQEYMGGWWPWYQYCRREEKTC